MSTYEDACVNHKPVTDDEGETCLNFRLKAGSLYASCMFCTNWDKRAVALADKEKSDAGS